ncbi:DUF2798 domain-containing protein [Ferrimonas pelagia]|uniref:DUF2798 domain-containing protein n=1 Tax=Ferrimonas pelagia TaxID=1177826 RepID=A0ABP9ECJ0_9GAMM
MKDPQFWLTAILSSLIMGLFMSGLMTLLNLGLCEHFFAAWRRSFSIGWPVALLFSVLILPTVRRGAEWLGQRLLPQSDSASLQSDP